MWNLLHRGHSETVFLEHTVNCQKWFTAVFSRPVAGRACSYTPALSDQKGLLDQKGLGGVGSKIKCLVIWNNFHYLPSVISLLTRKSTFALSWFWVGFWGLCFGCLLREPSLNPNLDLVAVFSCRYLYFSMCVFPLYDFVLIKVSVQLYSFFLIY